MFRDLATLMNSPLRIKALAYILKRPQEAGIVAEFASVANVSREQAQKELNALVRLGILRAQGHAHARKYFADKDDPLYEPIKHLLVGATTPTDQEIIRTFKGVRGLWLIVAAGVFADEARSSADLLVVTKNPDEPGLEKAIKKIETLSAVPVRYAIMEVTEYLGRRQAYDRLLRDIFEYTHRIVLERGG